MTGFFKRGTTPRSGFRLLRRDLLLLPAIFLLTWAGIAVAGEVVARWYFPDQERDACQLGVTDGNSFKPHCHSVTKMFESGWIESDYNDCGYRSAHSCRTKPPNGLRVAVLGTSISRSYWVSYPQSFGGRLEDSLTRICKRPVDVQAVSLANSIDVTSNGWIPFWHHVVDRVPEALSLRPNAMVLVMSAFDLASYDVLPDQAAPPPHAGPSTRPGVVKRVKDFLANDSRLILVLRHFAYRNANRYVVHELSEGDSTGYVRQPFSAKWSLRLRVADETIGKIAAQANAANVPLFVVLMPSRTQAALSSPGVDRHDTHPFAFGRALAGIVRAHHAHFIDVTDAASRLPDPASLFYVINGHPNAKGDAVLARAVESGLRHDVQDFVACGSKDNAVRSASSTDGNKQQSDAPRMLNGQGLPGAQPPFDDNRLPEGPQLSGR